MDAERGKIIGIGMFVLIVALSLVDMVALRGEQVASANVSLRAEHSDTISISRVGEEHLVEVTTRKRSGTRNKDKKGRSIAFRIVDPEGRTLVDSSEFVAHKTRFFEFTPRVAGDYTLHAEETMNLIGGGSGSARVSVYVNDRRVLGRLFALLPF